MIKKRRFKRAATQAIQKCKMIGAPLSKPKKGLEEYGDLRAGYGIEVPRMIFKNYTGTHSFFVFVDYEGNCKFSVAIGNETFYEEA